MPEEREVSIAEAIKSLAFVQEALINIVEQKGIATRQEIMEEVKRLALANLKQNN